MTNDRKRGGTVAENENGKLERDGSSNTYIGTATLDDGKVITKRFRGNVPDEPRIIASWEKWQGRKTECEEEAVEESTKKQKSCPFSGRNCGPSCPLYSPTNRACTVMLGGIALYSIGSNLMRLDPCESIEMVALAVGELAKAAPKQVTEEPKADDGLDAFLDGKTFLSFVNLHSKTVGSQYRKFCKENGYEPMGEHELLEAVDAHYKELKRVGVRGGSVFEAA